MSDSISVAQARQAGISPKQLRSKAWTRIGRDLYRPTDATTCDDPREQRLHDLRPVLGSETPFAHLTAAALYGLWLPTFPSWLAV